ncbi:MAG: insulinase family protein [Marinicella sp.]
MPIKKSFIIVMVLLLILGACQNNEQQLKPAVDTTTAQATQTNEPIKSQSDHRNYRHLVLENGLKVLLISDDKAEKSAAAMDISAGAFHAPKDRTGLLHFLEHMLFLGTEKYPKAGEYNEYLKKNGGSSNAYTSLEDTNYFFDVKNDAFDEALDRFAQFFIAPTMDPQYVDREKNAVDSEYSLKIKEDSRRINEANRQTINPDHPYSIFSVGNLDTLADRGDDKVYDRLMEVYKRHYSANRMALVVLNNLSLDAMEQSVREKFSAVKNNGLAKPVSKAPLLLEAQQKTRVNIVPLREMRTIELVFPIEDTQQYSLKKPTRLIAHLLGHEAQNSLYQSLSEAGLIESLRVDVVNTDALDAFSIEIELTEAGFEQLDQIIEDIFAYIDLIKREGVVESYYDELKKVAALNFTFQESIEPMATVYRLSPVLQETQVKNLLNTHYSYNEFDAELIHRFLAQLNPSNMRLTVVAPGLDTDKNEPLYDVDYSINKISQDLINRWANAKATSSMKLPILNPFVAEDIAMKEEGDMTQPSLAIDENGVELWHFQDSSFNMPKANVYVRIESPLAGDKVQNRAMLSLASKMIEDKLNAYGYNAKKAGLRYSLFESDKGMGYTVSGYNDKQIELINAINSTITSFDMTAEKFAVVKSSLIRDWNNAALDRPISQVFARLNREIGVDPFSKAAMAEALKPVDLAQLENYMKMMLSQVRLQVLTHGNTSEKEALELGKILHSGFLKNAQLAEKYHFNPKMLETGVELVVESDIDHEDSAIVLSYPMNTSLLGIRNSKMLGQVLSAAFFNDIRTTQQLGYVTSAFAREARDLPLLIFLIQSSKVGPVELQARVDEFIAKQYEVIQAMSEEEFEQFKAGLMTNIERKDKNLVERTSRLWAELADGYTDFDKQELESAMVAKMTKQELIDVYQSVLISPDRKRLIARNFGKAHRGENYQEALKDTTVCREEPCVL